MQIINDLCALHAEIQKLDVNSDMYAACKREEKKLRALLDELSEKEEAARLMAANSG